MPADLPVLLYDGDCGFCGRAADVARARVPGQARVIAYQSVDVGAWGLTHEQCDAALQLVVADGVRSGADAVVGYLRLADCRAFRRLGALTDRPPVLRLLRPAYAWVARHRHRLPGGSDVCQAPHTSGTTT